jgi:hypothetical protein
MASISDLGYYEDLTEIISFYGSVAVLPIGKFPFI